MMSICRKNPSNIWNRGNRGLIESACGLICHIRAAKKIFTMMWATKNTKNAWQSSKSMLFIVVSFREFFFIPLYTWRSFPFFEVNSRWNKATFSRNKSKLYAETGFSNTYILFVCLGKWPNYIAVKWWIFFYSVVKMFSLNLFTAHHECIAVYFKLH